jgi:hypothetical protein
MISCHFVILPLLPLCLRIALGIIDEGQGQGLETGHVLLDCSSGEMKCIQHWGSDTDTDSDSQVIFSESIWVDCRINTTQLVILLHAICVADRKSTWFPLDQCCSAIVL